jgi:hypothetical protein
MPEESGVNCTESLLTGTLPYLSFLAIKKFKLLIWASCEQADTIHQPGSN